jgi:hypothetical protein
MNITKQTVWNIEAYTEGYWINRAIEGLNEELGLKGSNTLDEVAFATREAAIEVATRLLRKYVEATPNSWAQGCASVGDYEAALRDIGRSLANRHGVSSATRWAGEPSIGVNEDGEVVLTRPTEVQLAVTTKTVKTVVIEGEAYTREIEDGRTSAWYPGTPEIVRVGVYSEELVIAG